MGDLVERLQRFSSMSKSVQHSVAGLAMEQAADEITALRARLEVVEKDNAALQLQISLSMHNQDAAEIALSAAYRAGLGAGASLAWSDDEDRPWEHWGEDRNVRTAQTVSQEIAAAIRALPVPTPAEILAQIDERSE